MNEKIENIIIYLIAPIILLMFFIKHLVDKLFMIFFDYGRQNKNNRGNKNVSNGNSKTFRG
jgi:hypothetical protein